MSEYLQWLLQWLPGEGSKKNERRRARVSSESEKQELRLWFRGSMTKLNAEISIYIRDGIFISLYLPVKNTGKRRRCRKGPSGHGVASKAAQYPWIEGRDHTYMSISGRNRGHALQRYLCPCTPYLHTICKHFFIKQSEDE